MDSTVFIVGFAFFLTTSVLLAGVFAYYVISGYRKMRDYNKDEWIIKWHKSMWIYLSFLTITFLFTILYMAQYLGQGFAQKPNMMLIAYLRWVFIAITSGLVIGNLAYVMFSKPHGGQSFFTVFFYVFAMILFVPASLSQDGNQRILWITCSILSFIMTVLLLFFPVNKITGKDYKAAQSTLFNDSCSDDTLIKSWSFNYKLLYLIHIIIIYVIYLVIWFLSDVNEFVTVINFENSMISYLVFDLVSVLPFIIILAILTFTNRSYKLTLMDRVTKNIKYANKFA